MIGWYQAPGPDTPIAVAAPAGAVREEELEAGLAALRRLLPGARILLDARVRGQRGYLSGTDQERAGHLTELLTGGPALSVLCARGGYGASRLLPLLDFDAIAAGRRLLVGFSDVTCLLNHLAASGLVAVHGPVVTQLPRLDQASLSALAGLLSGQNPFPLTMKGLPLAGGRATGRLLGGNLTLLCHLMGTPYQPDFNGAILFMEEVGEAAYRLDRLLTQLELAGVWGQVAGVAVGQITGRAEERGFMEEAVIRRLAGQGVPVVMDLPVGHGSQNLPLPMGAGAMLDADGAVFTVGLDL